MPSWRSFRDWFEYEFEITLPIDGQDCVAVGEATVEFVAEPPDRSVGETGPQVQFWINKIDFTLYGDDDVEVKLPAEQMEHERKVLKKYLEQHHQYEMYEKAEEIVYDHM